MIRIHVGNAEDEEVIRLESSDSDSSSDDDDDDVDTPSSSKTTTRTKRTREEKPFMTPMTSLFPVSPITSKPGTTTSNDDDDDGEDNDSSIPVPPTPPVLLSIPDDAGEAGAVGEDELERERRELERLRKSVKKNLRLRPIRSKGNLKTSSSGSAAVASSSSTATSPQDIPPPPPRSSSLGVASGGAAGGSSAATVAVATTAAAAGGLLGVRTQLELEEEEANTRIGDQQRGSDDGRSRTTAGSRSRSRDPTTRRPPALVLVGGSNGKTKEAISHTRAHTGSTSTMTGPTTPTLSPAPTSTSTSSSTTTTTRSQVQEIHIPARATTTVLNSIITAPLSSASPTSSIYSAYYTPAEETPPPVRSPLTPLGTTGKEVVGRGRWWKEREEVWGQEEEEQEEELVSSSASSSAYMGTRVSVSVSPPSSSSSTSLGQQQLEGPSPPLSSSPHPHPYPPRGESSKSPWPITLQFLRTIFLRNPPTGTSTLRPLILDTRAPAAHTSVHIRGSVNIAIPSLILKRTRKASVSANAAAAAAAAINNNASSNANGNGSTTTLDSLRQFVTNDEGRRVWDALVGRGVVKEGSDYAGLEEERWNGDIIVYDDEPSSSSLPTTPSSHIAADTGPTPGNMTSMLMEVLTPLIRPHGGCIGWLVGGIGRLLREWEKTKANEDGQKGVGDLLVFGGWKEENINTLPVVVGAKSPLGRKNGHNLQLQLDSPNTQSPTTSSKRRPPPPLRSTSLPSPSRSSHPNSINSPSTPTSPRPAPSPLSIPSSPLAAAIPYSLSSASSASSSYHATPNDFLRPLPSSPFNPSATGFLDNAAASAIPPPSPSPFATSFSHATINSSIGGSGNSPSPSPGFVAPNAANTKVGSVRQKRPSAPNLRKLDTKSTERLIPRSVVISESPASALDPGYDSVDVKGSVGDTYPHRDPTTTTRLSDTGTGVDNHHPSILTPPPKSSFRNKPGRSATLNIPVPPRLHLDMTFTSPISPSVPMFNFGSRGGIVNGPSVPEYDHAASPPPMSAIDGNKGRYAAPWAATRDSPPGTPHTPKAFSSTFLGPPGDRGASDRLVSVPHPTSPSVNTARPEATSFQHSHPNFRSYSTDSSDSGGEENGAVPSFTVSTILPGFLFLGPELNEPAHVDELLDLGVKRILNLAIECNEDDYGLNLGQVFERYSKIPMRDVVEEEGVAKGVREVCDILDDARLHSAPTYVHCKAGKSRSVTAVMAYLIHANHWTLSRAYAFVTERRKGISPNIGFVTELMNFEEQELGGKSIGVQRHLQRMQTTASAGGGNAGGGSNGHGHGNGSGEGGGGGDDSAGIGFAGVGLGLRRGGNMRESLPPPLESFSSTSSSSNVSTSTSATDVSPDDQDSNASTMGAASATATTGATFANTSLVDVMLPVQTRVRVGGDSGQEMEVKDASGRYRHVRRAPVDETTLQPIRRVSKAGLESGIFGEITDKGRERWRAQTNNSK